MNVKPGRVGGLTHAIAIHHLCREAGVPCWVGGMLESAVGSSICTALAMLDNFTYPADIFPTERFYRQDLADPPLVLHRAPLDVDGDSTSHAPHVRAFERLPEPAPDRLAKLTVQSAVIQR